MVKPKVKKSRLTVIRTAVGSPPVARLIMDLKKAGARVVGLDCDPRSAGFYLCDARYVIPRADDPRFLKEFLKICDRESAQAVISGPEEEVIILAKNKKLLQARGILLLAPDYETAKICFDKTATNKFFQKENIPVPKIYQADQVKFPAIVKPRFGRGGSGVHQVNNQAELEFYLKKVDRPIIQEFIVGQEYTVDILADLNGQPLSIVPRQRISVESGVSMKGKTARDQALIDYCRLIVKKLKIIGPCCIQCIKNDRGYHFLEINTRFGGGSALSMEADPTIILNLMRLIKGERPRPSHGFKENLTMLRYYSEIYSEDL